MDSCILIVGGMMKVLDEQNVLLTREEMVKINRIINYSFLKERLKEYLKSSDEKFVISASFLVDIMDDFESCLRSIRELNLVGTGVDSNLEEELSRLLSEDLESLKLVKKENRKLIVCSELINKLYEIVELNEKLYKLKDLKSVKNIIFQDLAYFCAEETLQQMEKEFQEKLSQSDVEGLEEFLNRVHSLIINHWCEYITDLNNFDSNKPYNLLCHSTDSTSFNGDFYTRYVSCSLLCEELTDTYRSGYGFILSPKDIVLANSSDLYVFNSSEDDETLLQFSTIKKVSSPERAKEEALRYKLENQKNGSHDKVYTEIVVDGFHPIGIFCLYDGSKELSYNYQMALKLKESYPNLEIFCLNVMLQKSETELEPVKKTLINRISQKVGILNHDFFFDEEISYKDFELFWKKYLSLIQKENYTVEDIITIYRENEDLLSTRLDLSHLFDGTYQEEQIRQILYYNPQIRIIDIINGKATVSLLEELYNVLIMYKDNQLLETIIPGINTFLTIYPFTIIDDMRALGLQKCNSMESLLVLLSESPSFYQKDSELSEDMTYASFYNIYSHCKTLAHARKLKDSKLILFMKLYEIVSLDASDLEKLKHLKEYDFASINAVLLSALSRKKESVNDKVNRYEAKVESLEQEKTNVRNMIESYDNACNCCSQGASYAIARKEVGSLVEQINQIKLIIEEGVQEIAMGQNSIAYHQSRLAQYSKHRILNSFRIRILNQKLEKEKFLVFDLERRISIKKGVLEHLMQVLTEVKVRFKERTGIPLDNYEEELQKSKDILDTVDVSWARKKLDKLDSLIEKVENILKNYKKEIGNCEDLEGAYRK